MNPILVVKAHLEKHGWTKKKFTNVLGESCLVGATELEFRNSGINRMIVKKELAEVIRQKFPERTNDDLHTDEGTIITFNDNLDTTFEDVKGVLQEAAEKWSVR
jgi:hypothetical protein